MISLFIQWDTGVHLPLMEIPLVTYLTFQAHIGCASIITKHMMDVEGGSLDGKKIALVYHNSAYGKEPIRTLEELSKKHGFELVLLPVDHPGQEQKVNLVTSKKRET